ncbi:MAG: hypothetical protein JO365_00455 [Bradyrhizobium sp.]|nr:hypothetical protein [Bradyrhizobium sp.]
MVAVQQCSDAVKNFLQNNVNQICKPYPRRCRPGDSCQSMDDRIVQFSQCANARKTIDDVCFGGGDYGHQIAYTSARQDAAICVGLTPTAHRHDDS